MYRESERKRGERVRVREEIIEKKSGPRLGSELFICLQNIS